MNKIPGGKLSIITKASVKKAVGSTKTGLWAEKNSKGKYRKSNIAYNNALIWYVSAGGRLRTIRKNVSTASKVYCRKDLGTLIKLNHGEYATSDAVAFKR